MSAAEVEVGTEPEADVAVEDEAVVYAKFNKATLQKYADKHGVEYSAKDTKDVLIAKLEGTYVEAAKAPVSELLPVIRVGHWVRFASHKGVPTNLVGRDGVVVNAPVKRAQGGDAIATGPYEYQDGSEVFLVEARETRDLLSLTRDAFASFDTDVSRLAVA